MGTSNYSDDFKRDAVIRLWCGGIRFGRFPGDWGSALIRSTSG